MHSFLNPPQRDSPQGPRPNEGPPRIAQRDRQLALLPDRRSQAMTPEVDDLGKRKWMIWGVFGPHHLFLYVFLYVVLSLDMHGP